MPVSGIQLKAVNHVVTMVLDTQRSMDFYVGILGFKQILSMVDNPNITWLQLPSGTMLHLIETENAPVRPENVHHAFEVEDFGAALQALEERGISIERSGTRHDGQRFMFFRDPDGTQVELCTASGF